MSLNVLIIDDDPVVREYLKLILSTIKTIGTIDFSINGFNAQALIRDNDYQMIFLDLNLPDGNGFDLLKQYEQIKTNLYVIILTGNLTPETIKKAINANVKGYVLKPFSSARIEQLISEYP